MREARGHHPIGHHLVLRPMDSRVIATTDAQRRIVAQSVTRMARDDRVLAFGLVDTHLHIENAEGWTRCGWLAQRVATSLRRLLKLPVSFVPVHREPILSQSHLYKAFYYDLRQQDHHGVTTDPYHEASNLPDLLGLRALGCPLNQHVRDLLPRVTRRELFKILGVPELPEDAPVTWERLPAAASAAAGLPGLRGNQPDAVVARAAAVQVAAAGGLRTAAIAELLQMSTRRVRSARGRLVDPILVRAVRLQLVLRTMKAPPSNGI